MDRSKRLTWFYLPAVLILMLFLTAGTAFGAMTGTMEYSFEYECWLMSFTAPATDTVYLKLELPFSGLLYVDGVSRANGDSSWGQTEVTMVNKGGSRRDRYSSNYVNMKNGLRAAYGVTTGTYYLKIRMIAGKEYLIRACFPKNGISADYGGKKKSAAYRLPRGKTRNGVVSCRSFSQQRWFVFDHTSSKTARVRVKVNGGQGTLRVYVSGPGIGTVKREVLAEPYDTNSCSVKLGRKGRYYVLVTKDAGSANKRSSGQFSIKWWIP